MIKQINLITLFLCAGQEGPFYLINPSALLYIYYLLFTIYCIYSQLDCVGLCPLPGVHTLLPEHLAVSVAPQVLQGNPSCHYHHHSHHHNHHHCHITPPIMELQPFAAATLSSWSSLQLLRYNPGVAS